MNQVASDESTMHDEQRTTAEVGRNRLKPAVTLRTVCVRSLPEDSTMRRRILWMPSMAVAAVLFLWPDLLMVVEAFQAKDPTSYSVGVTSRGRRAPSRMDRRVAGQRLHIHDHTHLPTTGPQVLHQASTATTSTALNHAVLRLPSCTAAQVPGVAVTAGGTALLSQLLLTWGILLSQQNKSRSHKQQNDDATTTQQQSAAYLAHSITAMGLMVLVSWMGVQGYYFNTNTNPPVGINSIHKMLLDTDDSARWLAAVLAGALALWDVPTSLAVRALRKPDVVLHHVVMAVTAGLGATQLPMPFLYFYLGVSELSSIPLLVYDQLVQWTTNKQTTATTASDGDVTDTSVHNNRLVRLRDTAQGVAAVAFTAVRAVLFPWVTLRHFLPSVWQVLQQQHAFAITATTAHVLRFATVASAGFTVLQLYWFSKMVRVVVFGDEANDIGEHVS